MTWERFWREEEEVEFFFTSPSSRRRRRHGFDPAPFSLFASTNRSSSHLANTALTSWISASSRLSTERFRSAAVRAMMIRCCFSSSSKKIMRRKSLALWGLRGFVSLVWMERWREELATCAAADERTRGQDWKGGGKKALGLLFQRNGK